MSFAEVMIANAKGLKNVNWRHGPNKPYVVVWVDPNHKTPSRVDEAGDTEANWNQTLVIPLPPGPYDHFTLFIDVVHAGPEPDAKPLIGSARLKLCEVLRHGDKGNLPHTVTLTRPSGRPQGKLDVRVIIRDMGRYHGGAPASYYSPPCSVCPPSPAPPAYGYQYGASPPVRDSYCPAVPLHSPQQMFDPYYASAPSSPQQMRDSYFSAAAVPPSGLPYNGYYASAPAMAGGYGQPGYGNNYQVGGYGGNRKVKKKSKLGGMGTGLAAGAAAGALGGLALGQGIDYVVDDIEAQAEEEE